MHAPQESGPVGPRPRGLVEEEHRRALSYIQKAAGTRTRRQPSSNKSSLHIHQPHEPTGAAFAAHPATAARRPSALALPLEHEPQPKKRNNFLGRLLKRRGGDTAAGKADVQGPVAEAVGTGILTLAIGLMSAASGGLGGAWFGGVRGGSGGERGVLLVRCCLLTI